LISPNFEKGQIKLGQLVFHFFLLNAFKMNPESIRKKMRMSQAEFAELLGLDGSHYSKIARQERAIPSDAQKKIKSFSQQANKLKTSNTSVEQHYTIPFIQKELKKSITSTNRSLQIASIRLKEFENKLVELHEALQFTHSIPHFEKASKAEEKQQQLIKTKHIAVLERDIERLIIKKILPQLAIVKSCEARIALYSSLSK
jgi:transcriptional regulator with XRE-family HTH domain